MTNDPLYVTRPLSPPLSRVHALSSRRSGDSKQLTNAGPFHVELEARLADYLGVEHLSLFTNGTIALVTALQALGPSGEVITTPYSFVATAHSLIWNNIRPVFTDIDPRTCNLDPARIEEAITPRTTAILPVHCYGTPCDVEAIGKIAADHGLKVIYDAAHAFGVNYRNHSLLRHGDLSILSFHATKVFHTFEGGAIISPSAAMKERIDFLKNFGFADETIIVDAGINGKMSEIQAAMGLLQLDYIDAAIRRRGEVDALYRRELEGVAGLKFLPVLDGYTPNYSYCPLLVDDGYPETRDQLYARLRAIDVYTRRYFFPLISDMPMYRHLPSAGELEDLLRAKWIADRVLCLPIYPRPVARRRHAGRLGDLEARMTVAGGRSLGGVPPKSARREKGLSLTANAAANGASQLYLVVCTLLVMPYFLRRMGAETYGLIGFFTVMTAWFQILDAGLSLTLSRESARFRAGAIDAPTLRGLMSVLEVIFVLVAGLGAAAIAASAHAIAAHWLRANHLSSTDVGRAVLLMGLTVPLQWMTGLYRGAINGFERQVWLAGFNMVMTTLRFLGAAVAITAAGADTVELLLLSVGKVSILELAVLAGHGPAARAAHGRAASTPAAMARNPAA